MSEKSSKSKNICSVCGDPIDLKEGEKMEIADMPYFFIEQIKKNNPDIHRELMKNDGTLIYHTDCYHPIEDLLSVPTELIDEIKNKYDIDGIDTKECSVCGLVITEDREQCPRCGNRR